MWPAAGAGLCNPPGAASRPLPRRPPPEREPGHVRTIPLPRPAGPAGADSIPARGPAAAAAVPRSTWSPSAFSRRHHAGDRQALPAGVSRMCKCRVVAVIFPRPGDGGGFRRSFRGQPGGAGGGDAASGRAPIRIAAFPPLRPPDDPHADSPARQHRRARHAHARGRRRRLRRAAPAGRLARGRGHRLHRRGRHHRRVADRGRGRALRDHPRGGGAGGRAGAGDGRLRRQLHRRGDRPGAVRAPGRRQQPAAGGAVLQQAWPGRPVPPLQGHRRSHRRPADRALQRAGPHRGRPAARHRAAAGAGARHRRHQGGHGQPGARAMAGPRGAGGSRSIPATTPPRSR